MYAIPRNEALPPQEANPTDRPLTGSRANRIFVLVMILYAFLLLAIGNRDALGARLGEMPATARGEEHDARQEARNPTAAPGDSAFGAPAAGLSARMQAALEHTARRFRVSQTTLTPVFMAAQDAAKERGLDPLLIVAVIAVESSFNPFSESQMGAQGLMQVIPRFHQDKVPGDAGTQPFLDPVTNVRIGAHVLQEAIRMRGGLNAGLQYYGGATDTQDSYATKVLAEKDRLEQQVALRVGATSATLKLSYLE